MSFSAEWDDLYRSGAQNSVWPWSDLVSLVMRYARPDRRPYRVLELGFGAGANVQFLLSIGAEYFGIEGSAAAVAKVRDRLGGESRMTLACGDFTQSIPFDGLFDLVVDRSSITHNSTPAIQQCLALVNSSMRSGGKLIGIDWFSTLNADFLSGVESGDYYTRAAFASGQFKGVGVVHFSDERHLEGLLTGAGFRIERLDHKKIDTGIPIGSGAMAWWNFVAVKP
jgi:SAM-dependent methyltransferase